MDLTFLDVTKMQLLSLVILIITSIDYFKKRKILTIENYVYTFILILTITLLITCILMYWSAILLPIEILLIILNKIYAVNFAGVILFTAYYIFLISSKKYQGYISLEDNKELSYFSKIGIVIISTLLLVAVLTLGLDMVFYQDSLLFGIGPVFYVVYAVCILMVFISFYFMIKERKKIPFRVKLPYYTFLLIIIGCSIIQFFYNDIIIIECACSFSVCFFGFTIENPDVNLIESLNIAKQSAEKANRAKTDFLSSMSHEIRTPLNAIVGFSHALVEEKISPEVMEEVNDIIESSNSLLSVINNILDISKMDAGGIVITPIDYSSSKLVNSIAAYAEELTEKKKINFVKEIDKDLPPVLFGDNVRIKQIVNNLISNAVKFTENGDITLSVKAIPLKNKCKLYISVKDTGVGISEDDMSKIYDQFNKLNNEVTTNYAVGTGLGLTISKRLLEMMDGTIDFESTVGEGSKFLVTFDQIISEKQLIELEEYVPEELHTFDCSKYKILVIDDNTVNLKVVRKLFRDYNVEPILSQSVTDCIKKIEDGEKYDIIFMDDMMPSMTGSEAIVVLRKIPGFSIPTIILTANQTPGIKQKYIDIGFDDYLAKPIIKDELCFMLNKYFNSSNDKKDR